MMITRLVYLLSVVLGASLTPTLLSAAGKFSYDKNTFIQFYGCVAVKPGEHLALKDKVLTFPDDGPITSGEVISNIPGLLAQKQMYERVTDPMSADMACANTFHGDVPESLVRLSSSIQTDHSSSRAHSHSRVSLVVRGLPADALIAEKVVEKKGFPGEIYAKFSLLDARYGPYVQSVRHLVTDTCYAPDSTDPSDSLVRLVKFQAKNGDAVVQLDFGKLKRLSLEKKKWLTEKKEKETQGRDFEEYYGTGFADYAKESRQSLQDSLAAKGMLESVSICRFVLHGKRVVKAENISRAIGLHERNERGMILDILDDTSPYLNIDNWADTPTRIAGFISLNKGKDWDAVVLKVTLDWVKYSIESHDGSGISGTRYFPGPH